MDELITFCADRGLKYKWRRDNLRKLVMVEFCTADSVVVRKFSVSIPLLEYIHSVNPERIIVEKAKKIWDKY